MIARTSSVKFALLVLTGSASLLALAADAEAQRRRPGDGYGSVTACSRYGNGCISGALRPARGGYEVRMPGGTWIFCARDCSNTLREQTVDFWQTQQERGANGHRR